MALCNRRIERSLRCERCHPCWRNTTYACDQVEPLSGSQGVAECRSQPISQRSTGPRSKGLFNLTEVFQRLSPRNRCNDRGRQETMVRTDRRRSQTAGTAAARRVVRPIHLELKVRRTTRQEEWPTINEKEY